ncbi:MAG: HAD family hydrolase [Rhodospirillum sp.]|nr:HAD family hydrolase [Rhodospirillum sp.]MCF8489445.1 HAD family hydrolase [Rhodospirillum sp.]MCF8500959.1 HAD family hydrolase [Rhodospirillum sp.]
MPKCTMIVIDIDRTTLTDDHRLLPEVVTAVRAARAAGIDIIPATARSPEALRPIMACLNLSGTAICFNGAWTGVVGEETSVVQHGFPLATDLAGALIAAADQAGLNPCWFGPEQWYAGSDGPLVEREMRATGTTPLLCDHIDVAQGPIYKVLCLEDPSRGGFIRGFRDDFAGKADFVRSDRYLVEVVNPGISKRAAIARLAEDIGLSADHIAAIGDSENDLELIKWAGTGVAMGNATEAVKVAADWITETNARAGVALAIERLLAVPPAT